MTAKKKMIQDFVALKQQKEKITFITAYDFPTATFRYRLQKYGLAN